MAELHIRVSPGWVDVDNARIEAWARNPAGEVARDMLRRANNVESSARFDAPRDTGLLASTLRSQMDFSGAYPSATVTVGRSGLTPYLGYVLFGTAPHIIEAIQNRPNPHLRFIPRGGGVVFAKRVFHPGTAADNFLVRALVARAGG